MKSNVDLTQDRRFTFRPFSDDISIYDMLDELPWNEIGFEEIKDDKDLKHFEKLFVSGNKYDRAAYIKYNKHSDEKKCVFCNKNYERTPWRLVTCCRNVNTNLSRLRRFPWA